ncbi:MAG TPA: ATP-binding cassette domain-containing protein [Oscillospiraceae bacterium]|nr:ATP-binding cassette domain-containing protein [Oscillospiraceae bacterium]
MSFAAEGLTKRYPGKDGMHTVFEQLSFSLPDGAFLVVLGRSGVGKSTLLRVLAGIEKADAGEVLLDGAPRAGAGRDVFFIFQDFNQLFPWMTLEQNLTYALRRAKLPESTARAREALGQVDLLDAAGKYPRALSGGMKQRGALARALALRSRVLLLDEPFSSLDPITRRQCGETLLRLWRARDFTAVFVTHDIGEALSLGTGIAVLGRAGLSFFDPSAPGLAEDLENALGDGGEKPEYFD